MIQVDTSVTFTDDDSAVSDGIWINLTQENYGGARSKATVSDIRNMINYAEAGYSAFEYILESCPYITVKDGNIVVTIPFYVWPSFLDMPYKLTANGFGVLTLGDNHEEHKSFDVVFSGSNEESLDFVFEGTVTQEGQIFTPGGVPTDVSVTLEESKVVASRDIFGTFRAVGTAKGYTHDIVLTFPPNESITDIKVVVTAEYNGYTNSLNLELPPCVTDILESCYGNFPGWVLNLRPDEGEDEEEQRIFVVYYSTCNGKVVLERWEPR